MDNAQVETIMWHRKQGLTLEQMRYRGRCEHLVIEDLVTFLDTHSPRDANGKMIKMLPAGHNIGRFDIPILWRAAYVCGIDMDAYLDHHLLDTCGMAYERYVFKLRSTEKVSLRKLAVFLGIEIDESQTHKAKYDMFITNQVLRHMMDVQPEPKTLEQVFAAEDAKHGA